MPVVHVIAARLRPDSDSQLLDTALEAASALSGAPGVSACRVGVSATQLVVAVWLPDATALEPFAASPLHMSFVMRGLAPLIEGMWSVSVATDRDPPKDETASISVFAIPEADGVFEWQIRRQLELIAALPGDAWVGPTVEERERYRAGGVVLLDHTDEHGFEARMAENTDSALALELADAPAFGVARS